VSKTTLNTEERKTRGKKRTITNINLAVKGGENKTGKLPLGLALERWKGKGMASGNRENVDARSSRKLPNPRKSSSYQNGLIQGCCRWVPTSTENVERHLRIKFRRKTLKF